MLALLCWGMVVKIVLNGIRPIQFYLSSILYAFLGLGNGGQGRKFMRI
jgi:hypothetical protein